MASKPKSKELGFGTLAAANSQRFMNADGSANVHRVGGPAFSASDLFHRLTTMKWRKFILMVLVSYVTANLLFAVGYYLCGIENIGVTPSGSFAHDFAEAFFFSTQCFTTIGFGRVNPSNMATNTLASLEGLVGLLSLAIATGLLYGRFSRPIAHLIHSKHLLISPYQKDGLGAMFRIASTRKHSILIENTVAVSMGINSLENGVLRRRFFTLDLELDKINFLNLSWTIVHPITENSPLWGKSYEDLIDGRVEFIVLFKAMEETTNQTVIERFSYFIDELVWGAKFISAIGTNAEGQPVLDLDRIDDFNMHEIGSIAGLKEDDATAVQNAAI